MNKPIINKKAVKEYILETTREKRPGWDCSQVKTSVLTQIDEFLKERIDGAIHRHPTKGKTFMQF